ncbi:hypothetical protein GJ496_002720, partial [Pomphorhynchus laevis]
AEAIAKRCRNQVVRSGLRGSIFPAPTIAQVSLFVRVWAHPLTQLYLSEFSDRVLSSSRIADSNARPFDLLTCVWISPANTLRRILWNMCSSSANVFASILFQAISSNSYRDYER